MIRIKWCGMVRAYLSAPITDGLVGHWKLDGNANDFSGEENHGTTNGDVSFKEGVESQCAELDGTDDYIDCGSDSSLDDLSLVTISSWINLNTFGGYGYGRILWKGEKCLFVSDFHQCITLDHLNNLNYHK